MPIAFEPTENTQRAKEHYHRVAAEQMRPISRHYDDHEHALPTEWVDFFWNEERGGPGGRLDGPSDGFDRIHTGQYEPIVGAES